MINEDNICTTSKQSHRNMLHRNQDGLLNVSNNVNHFKFVAGVWYKKTQKCNTYPKLNMTQYSTFNDSEQVHSID